MHHGGLWSTGHVATTCVCACVGGVQDDGLVALQQLGIRDLDRVQRWVLSDVTFDTVLKLFKSSVGDCSATETAEYLDTLLNSGLTGKVGLPEPAHGLMCTCNAQGCLGSDALLEG